MRSPRFGARSGSFTLALALCLGACSSDDSDTSSEASTTATSSPTASAEGSSTTTAESSDTNADSESESGGPLGEEYGPCPNGILDCPEGVLYACLTKITEGAVCAPECDDHADCPAPPPGGTVVPVCTQVDDRKRCLLALCESDDDCPTGMTCYADAFNYCHWQY